MDDIQLKIKEWGRAIRSVKFDGILEDIKTTIIVNSSTEINNGLYKLVLYLCQTSQQCDKTNTSNGINIFRITCALCSKLTSIPDVSNFFAAIYHIVCHLIDMKLYIEAMKLDDLFLPGTVFHAATTDSVDKYAALSSLWHKTTNKLLNPTQTCDEEKFEIILKLINHELNIQVLSLKDGSRYLLNKIIFYNEKVKSLGKKQFNEKFRVAMIHFLAQTKISLGHENKFQTYKASLRLLNEMILDKITIENMQSMHDRAKQFFIVFRTCMTEDKQCYDCFMIYDQLCRILIRRVEEFTPEHFRAIKICMKNIDAIIAEYGSNNAVQSNSYSILQVVNALQICWSGSKGIGKHVLEKFIRNITIWINYQSIMFSNFQLIECSCGPMNCSMTVDTYNHIALKSKVLSMIIRCIDELSADITDIATDIAEECVELVYSLRNANCHRWCKIWPSIGSLIYNIAVNYEKIKYDDIIKLYTLLATATIKLDAFHNGSSYISSDNPLSVTLHRLSNTHYFHGKYDEAMAMCALNAYVAYANETCKAFRFWTSIKYKHPSSHNCTIVYCLKSNKDAAHKLGIDIDLENCDIATICVREIKSLHEAEIDLSSSIKSVLDLMRVIDVPSLMYSRCVLQLGYHLLNFTTNIPILAYINEALSRLKQDAKQTLLHTLLKGYLKLYQLIEVVNDISNRTIEEMKDTKIKLYASRDANMHGNPASNVVPAYTLINVTTAKNIALKFERILEIWRDCHAKMKSKTVDVLEPSVMIRTTIVAAEYTRFFQYRNLEIDAWKIAHDLAEQFNDKPRMIYITARCVSCRHINNEWIQQAEGLIDTLDVTTDQTIIETVAMFKLSLSEFFFSIGLTTEADKLFDEATALPDIKFTKNLPTYLLSVDILLSYKFSSDYIENMVRGLYTMLTIDDFESITRHRREQRLYEMDILFQFTNHITLRMNSLLSYREISAHLVRRLSLAQKLAAPLHVAECLKNLCFIDLSRNELEDCEVKLQGLEHILMMETIERSMRGNLSATPSVPQLNVTPPRIMEPVRDVSQNDTSPVLQMKVFESPNFMTHNKKCKCFNCSNITYQYLIFSCTHIRAQLYASQNHINHALQHFEGAFNIIRKLLNLSDENVGYHSYHDIVEYVLFMLDFARFLKYHKPTSFDEGLKVALHAVEICEKYKTVNSPVYLTARELIFEYRFQGIYKNIDHLEFMMPNINNIDVSKYFDVDDRDEMICATPERIVAGKSAQSVRRKKTPPMLTLSKVSLNTMEDDGIIMSSLRPSRNIPVKKTTKIRPIRREISENEYDCNANSDGNDTQSTSKKKSSMKDAAERISDKNIEKQIIQKPNKQSGLRSRKKIFVSSDESSDESDNVDRVSIMLKDLHFSTISSNTEHMIVGSGTNSEVQLSVDNKMVGKRTTRANTCSIHNDETPREPSNRRKKNIADNPLSIVSGSDPRNRLSSESNDEYSTSCYSNIDSDDEVVECSIEEPRRSRRLALRTRHS